MTRLLTTSVLALGALVAVDSASAQSRFGLGAGYNFDSPDAPFVSAQVRTARGMAIPLRFNPHVDVLIPGGGDISIQGGLNGLYDFGVANASFTPYAGIGLGVGYDKRDEDDEGDADLGAQFLFGAEFHTTMTRPYLQLQIATNRGAGLAAGILF